MCLFDYSKLRGKITEIYGSQAKFAVAMGMSEKALSDKLTGKKPWKQPEMALAVQLLRGSEAGIPELFFTLKVQNIEQIA